MREKKRYRTMLLLVIGLVALLPVLAFMQYQWVGQLSASEAGQMRSNLRTSAHHFSVAFDRELDRAQYTFRVSSTESLDEVADQLRLNYRKWRVNNEHLALIEDIYWIDYDTDHTLRLHRFDPVASTLTQVPWPEDLEGWRHHFIERNRRQLRQLNLISSGEETSSLEDRRFMSHNVHLLASRPALPVPVSIDTDIDTRNLLANLDALSSGHASHTLLTLNKAYLTGSLMPFLYREHICKHAEIEYDLMVVSQENDDLVIFRTDSTLTPAAFDLADAVEEIGKFKWMSWPLTSASRIALSYVSVVNRDSLIAEDLLDRAQAAWVPAGQDSFSFESLEMATSFPLQAILKEARQQKHEGELTPDDLLNALTVLQDQSTEPLSPLPRPGTRSASLGVTEIAPPYWTPRAWKLLLRHKQGSLETALHATRRRNLILSFGILGVLGVAIVLIVISSQRAHLLAERQMDFVAGVSHELRTPLTVIRTAADNLADGVIDNPVRLRRYGELIGQEGRRLSEMVEQILELAGAQSGRRTYDFRPVGVRDLIEDVVTQYHPQLIEGGFTLDQRIEDDLPPILADARALQTALRNLIQNAIKYSSDRRWISISAWRIRRLGRSEIQISVRDRGPGIPAGEIAHIFEQFYRGRAVQQAQIHGNGLGLSLVKHILDAHGGTVTVASEVGRGSTFTLHLPIIEASQAVRETPMPASL